MPLLDVSSILSDPDFVSSFSVTRNAQSVSSSGLQQLTGTTTTQIGVVTPASPYALQRLPEGSRIEGAISVIAQFPLTAGTVADAADIVTWHGKAYTVRLVDDYSVFGAGFVEAVCELTDLTPA